MIEYGKKLNFITELKQLELWQRQGRTDLVIKKIQQISRFQLPREFLANFSELAYRANLFSTALLFLNKVVRSENSLIDKPTVKEKLFYAASLVGIGATDEAIEIFSEIDSNIEPEVLLYHSFALFGQWKYQEAIPFLQKFVLASGITDYRRLVGRINLSSAYIVEKQFEKADQILNECLFITKNENLYLLHGNCLELKSQIANANREYTEAYSFLKEAQSYLNKHHGRYNFFIDKGIAITNLLKSKGSSDSLLGLQILRQQAYEKKRWETLRDCDLYETLFTRDIKLITKLYRGTPYRSYRLRLMNLLGVNENVFIEKIDFSVQNNFFSQQNFLDQENKFQKNKIFLDISKGIFNQSFENRIEDISLTYLSSLHRLLQSLVVDFYKPASVGSLFARLYPGEYYNSQTSPNRIFSVIKRLNQWCKKKSIPLRVKSEDGYFLLNTSNQLIFKFDKENNKNKSFEKLSFDKLHDRFKTYHFTIRGGAEALQLSKTSMNELVNFGLNKNIIQKIGSGRSTVYRFCRKKKAA